jgi:hypothetical protein
MKVAQKLDFFNFSYYIIMYNENKKIKKEVMKNGKNNNEERKK